MTPNTTFSMSLGKLVAIAIAVIGMSFTVGTAYQGLLPDREVQKQQREEIVDIKITLAKVSQILENMEEKQKDNSRNISAIEEKTHVINNELQIISSSIKEEERRKHR